MVGVLVCDDVMARACSGSERKRQLREEYDTAVRMYAAASSLLFVLAVCCCGGRYCCACSLCVCVLVVLPKLTLLEPQSRFGEKAVYF